MESTTANNRRVTLSFYSGRSAPPPDYVRLQGAVYGGNKTSTREFNSQDDADEWAAQLGVQRWHVVRHTRAFPEAARTPITFAEAPDDEHLHELIAAFESGATLDQLADGVMVNTGDRQFQVHPNLLRLWLIGAAPDHPSLQRLKREH